MGVVDTAIILSPVRDCQPLRFVSFLRFNFYVHRYVTVFVSQLRSLLQLSFLSQLYFTQVYFEKIILHNSNNVLCKF